MRKIIPVLVTVIVLLTLLGCQSRQAADSTEDAPSVGPGQETTDETAESEQDLSCNCSDEYEPVCVNGQLYQNACTAECLGITDYRRGQCHDPEGKQMFPCGHTSGGLSAQQNTVCAKLHDTETGEHFWKSFVNSQTACDAGRPDDIEVEGFTRGECGS